MLFFVASERVSRLLSLVASFSVVIITFGFGMAAKVELMRSASSSVNW